MHSRRFSIRGSSRMSWLLIAQELENIGAIVAVFAAVVVLFVLLVIVAVFANYFRLWIQSFLTGAGITIWDLIGMTFRKVNKDVIVKSKIMAVQAGLDDDQGMTSKALEAHYMAGGEVAPGVPGRFPPHNGK